MVRQNDALRRPTGSSPGLRAAVQHQHDAARGAVRFGAEESGRGHAAIQSGGSKAVDDQWFATDSLDGWVGPVMRLELSVEHGKMDP